MAALVRHESTLKGLKVAIKWAQVAQMGKKYSPPKSKKPKLAPKPGPTFDSSAQSLACKGFLRPYKGYTPPSNVKDDICKLSTQIFGTSDKSTSIEEPKQRFEFLHACWKLTGHPVPNSLLHLMTDVGDVIEFYSTPVSTNTPLDNMKQKELPPNLHIIHTYKRYDQDPNNVFKGESAFPGSSTIFTNLKARKVYQNIPAKPPIHDWLALANWPYPAPK